jgi:hypothetical protein
MGTAVIVFLIPPTVRTRDLWHPRTWLQRVAWRPAVLVTATLGVGALLFAWRTWYFTGAFSIFKGTQRDLLAVWQPGMSLPAVLRRMAESVLMVLTVNDPPRFDPYALPVLGGAAAAALSLAAVPRLRDLPLSSVVFLLSGLVGALIARGSAYPGRFSLHVLPIASALAVMAIASVTRRWRTPGADARTT